MNSLNKFLMTFKFGTRFGPGPEKVSAKTFFFDFRSKIRNFWRHRKKMWRHRLYQDPWTNGISGGDIPDILVFLPLAEYMRFYLFTCVSPDIPTDGVSRIFS